MDVIASDFLAGSILSWAMPICLLIVVTIWYSVIVRRRSRDD